MRTGFLEEAPGVYSTTRLAVLLMVLCMMVLTFALSAYLVFAYQLTKAPPDPLVIGAFSAPLVPLAGGIWGSLKERT